jgi:DNA-binding transcriptional MocR family regulator
MQMTIDLPARALDVNLLARELGNWRTSSRSGPAYHGLADAIRLLIVDGRLPVGARRHRARDGRHAAGLRTTVTAAYAQLRDDGYQRPPRRRSTTALRWHRDAHRGHTADLSPLPHCPPGGAVSEAFVDATHDVTPYLHEPGHELVGVAALRQAIAERYCERGLPTEPDDVLVTPGRYVPSA